MLLPDAYISSQLVASGVAPLLAEQKSADRAGALLRFVSMKAGRLSTPCVRSLTPQLTHCRVSAAVSSA